MAQVPLRLAQPGLVAPHQQRPPMIVSMTQPPPVSIQGLVTMAPMMGPGGGMAVMTQAMNHPDSAHEHHHAMNGPYGPPHHPHHPGPRAHAPQHHGSHIHHHQSGPTPQAHVGPPPTPYHPHPLTQQNLSGPHSGPHSISHGGHHGHSVSHIAASHCTIATPASNQGHMQTTSQPQPQHSVAQQQVANVNTPNMNTNLHHSIMSSQGQSHHGPIVQQAQPNSHLPLAVEKGINSGGMIVLSNNNSQNRIAMSSSNVSNGLEEINPTVHCPDYDNSLTNGSDNMSMREKTPMCLINELARYNKIQHQYCLTDEKGPAHKKIFTVTLRIGETEEYTSSGASIKKAQHSAASIALKNTKFKHPPPKPPRQMQQPKLTPTVELNALAMKRGEAAVYSFIEAPRPPPNPYTFNVSPNVRTMYNQKYYCRPPLYSVFFVSLKVGVREFTGEGATAQQAKHNAASKALKSMKVLPLPKNCSPSPADLSELDPNADLKSPISLVHEIALKRNLQVMFEVVRESGPPHMRTFITTCIVGDFRTQGEGTGKKASKKRAAELMLEKLRNTLPPLPTNTLSVLKRKPTTKKKSRNLIKVGQEEQKAAPDYGQGINPISRLIQIQQAKKEKEPVYTLIAERGVPRRREFVMQVSVGSETATGSGQNKKLAKRAAAESMLQLLGYSGPLPAKSAIKMEGSHSDHDTARKQVTFMEETTDLSHIPNKDPSQLTMNVGGGRQLVPGLIMMPDGSAIHGYSQIQHTDNANPPVNIHATAAIAKELLESGSSATAKAMTLPQGSNPIQQAPSLNHAVAASPPKSTCPPHVQQQPASSHQTQPPPVQSTPLQPVTNNINTPQQPQFSHNMQPMHIQQQPTETAIPSNQNGSRNSLSLSSVTSEQAVRPKDQLMYLANILSLQVQFTDFPKGNKSKYLSLVSLSTKPPHVSHGAGPTIDESHDQACLNALRNLAEMGLDSVTSATEDP